MRFLLRFLRWLFGVAQNADGATLTEIKGTGDDDMTEITLRVGAAPRSFYIKPNKNDSSVEDIVRSISGGVTGDQFVSCSQFSGDPSNLLKVTLSALEAHPAGTTHATSPSSLTGTFDSATEPGETQTVSFNFKILCLPENADAAELEEII